MLLTELGDRFQRLQDIVESLLLLRIEQVNAFEVIGIESKSELLVLHVHKLIDEPEFAVGSGARLPILAIRCGIGLVADAECLLQIPGAG